MAELLPELERKRTWRLKWSIGIYEGDSPLALRPLGADRPILTARDVTDVDAYAVADPFMLRCAADEWFLFFEVVNIAVDRGEIAYATSSDGLQWTYGAVVLREPFHLSYPQVFEAEGAIWMIPETRQANEVRLYRAESFPSRWIHFATLLHGRFADATLLRDGDRWWLFAQRGLDELRLFSSAELTHGWIEHPASPLWPGNRRRTRPGGRMVRWNGRLLRFAQDGLPTYGNSLRAFDVEQLDLQHYAEHELAESPILRATRSGWNAVGMHHIDAVRLPDGRWRAAVDGAGLGLGQAV